MADFKTHITASSFLGAGYGLAGFFYVDMPLGSCIVAGGLCGLAGMLPDLDSDSGIPVRETLSFTSAVVPMLMVERLERIGLGHSSMVLIGGITYFLIRFGLWPLFKKFTKHRGMWHSLPAGAIALMFTFLVCADESLQIRLFRSWAVFLGFMSHLVLDELYAVDLNGKRLKRSFGTAMKFFGKSRMGNFFIYAKVLILLLAINNDPMVQRAIETRQVKLPSSLHYAAQTLQWDYIKSLIPHDKLTHEEMQARIESKSTKGMEFKWKDWNSENPVQPSGPNDLGN